MNQELWTAVDAYLNGLLVPSDSVLEDTWRSIEANGLPAIQVTPNQAKLLFLLARIRGARKILEIGTLAGYSTIWLARALPDDGRLLSLEADAKHAEVARRNIAGAGFERQVEVRLGAALATLPAIAAEGEGPFDFVFIDADKENMPEYFRWALRLTRSSSLIVVDNVVRKGAVIDEVSRDPQVQGVRRFHEMLAAAKGVSATAIQTVGSKGHDGFALIVVE